MSKYYGTSFPADAALGEDFFHTTSGLIYRFLGGGYPQNPLNWYIDGGSTATDPDTTGWGDKQRGAHWYNFQEQQFKGFNGTQIILIG